jgi:hypothetical protein
MATTGSDRARRWRERRTAILKELDDFPRPPWKGDAATLALSRWFARQLIEDRMSATVIAGVGKDLQHLACRFGDAKEGRR